jgi:hypothetical protein
MIRGILKQDPKPAGRRRGRCRQWSDVELLEAMLQQKRSLAKDKPKSEVASLTGSFSSSLND